MTIQTTERIIISGMQTLINRHLIVDHAIIVENGKITGIIAAEMIANHLPAHHIKFPPTHLMVPGFINVHVHGAKGRDVMDAEESALLVISQSLARDGVTSFLATTMSTEPEKLQQILSVVSHTLRNHQNTGILGVHLEGPFIAETKRGAQRVSAKPNIQIVKQWQSLNDNIIKIITLAPELTGADKLIALLKEMQIIASIGHTDASYQQTCLAIKQGCTLATHLFNAMSQLHHREPGAAAAILLSEFVRAELIVDGIHLHPAIVDMVYRLKGKENIVLITDGMRATGLGDGVYDLGGQPVTVENSVARLSNGVLAGSTLRMPDAIKNMMAYTGCSLIDAINMASYVPAQILKIDENKGSIDINKDADLVILNEDGQVVWTMRCGSIVFSA